ncbi:hypothetical protein JI58_03570 [Marinosulfonomonas sp. PRT-SC04]|nr:hypothetical protein JI58_03570 [Marinosulfonomonas sp. PRT-SC04]
MKLQVFGFAFIVALTVAGVDYSMQARKAEISLGVSGYVDSITGRFHAAAAARALEGRQSDEVKIHLPEAPEGWARRAWAEADTTRLEVKSDAMSKWAKRRLSIVELAPMMAGMAVADVLLAGRMQRKEIWVYERGEEIIALRVAYTRADAPKRFPGMDDKIEAANTNALKIATPFALVQGVLFGQIQPVLEGAGPIEYRGFSASMGSQVMIAVRAYASDESILSLMDLISFDGLNGMLDQPLDGVGNGAPALSQDQQFAMARTVMEARRFALFGEAPKEGMPVAVAEVDVAVEEENKVDLSKTFTTGFETVRQMPGQKCVRTSGSAFCNGFTN